MIGAPMVRTDIVDVYIFRRRPHDDANPIEFLQLHRAKDPMRNTWQPIMGHIERNETALATALREADEETALTHPTCDFIAIWALEQVWPYFLPADNCIVLSPRFTIEAHPTWEPALNQEHNAHRWIAWPAHTEAAQTRPATHYFLWPGQHHAINEIAHHIADPCAPASAHLRINL